MNKIISATLKQKAYTHPKSQMYSCMHIGMNTEWSNMCWNNKCRKEKKLNLLYLGPKKINMTSWFYLSTTQRPLFYWSVTVFVFARYLHDLISSPHHLRCFILRPSKGHKKQLSMFQIGVWCPKYRLFCKRHQSREHPVWLKQTFHSERMKDGRCKLFPKQKKTKTDTNMVRHQFKRPYAMLYQNILLKHYGAILGL